MNAENMVVEIKKSENEWALRDKTDAKLKWANTIEWNRSNLFPNINLHSYIIILKNGIVQSIVQNDYLCTKLNSDFTDELVNMFVDYCK